MLSRKFKSTTTFINTIKPKVSDDTIKTIKKRYFISF